MKPPCHTQQDYQLPLATNGEKTHKKQALFVAECLTDFNATRAAITAGYSNKLAE
jgi:hypothetical protein